MYKKVFLDANIFIDANDSSRLCFKDSSKILTHLANKEAKLFTSCDLITTIYYILSKNSKDSALSAIENINKFCNIIDFSNKEVKKSCALMRKNNKYSDLEDTLQYILAKKENCDLIVSNDKNFYSETIELLSSQEFCKKHSL
ncbi:MAG: PIN domain-containing protein [Helicobacteraceae bacterium]|nr:PIN domain-containing protein [Helicobacteraceae bacterium]